MNDYNKNILSTARPPIIEILEWLEEIQLPSGLKLLDVSQAAPSTPPPLSMRKHLSEVIIKDNSVHFYGPVLGRKDLRTAFRDHLRSFYTSNLIDFHNIAITSGCNQAFGATISTLAKEGDEIILPIPWYFNHKMWLDIFGIKAIPLPNNKNLTPCVTLAEDLVTEKTKAIVLITPNNPTGKVYPKSLIHDFFKVCVKYNIQLIVDETYKDFGLNRSPPHGLFMKKAWEDNYTLLYSFSKVFHLTGHRVGAVVTSKTRLIEMEKFLDSSTICPSQLGQLAALYGLNKLSNWVSNQRNKVNLKRNELIKCFRPLQTKGWKLSGLGAYFAYLEHPFDVDSKILSKLILEKLSILVVPGALFYEKDSTNGDKFIRIAFANISVKEIKILFKRLESFQP